MRSLAQKEREVSEVRVRYLGLGGSCGPLEELERGEGDFPLDVVMTEARVAGGEVTGSWGSLVPGADRGSGWGQTGV